MAPPPVAAPPAAPVVPFAAEPGDGTAATTPPAQGPTRWEAAYQSVIGPEPTLEEPTPPWPPCANSLVRAPLKAELERRRAKAYQTFQAAHAKWDAARNPIANAAASFFASPTDAAAPVKEQDPASGDRLRAAIGPIDRVPCYVVDIVAGGSGATSEEQAAAKAAGKTISGPQTYHILCTELDPDAPGKKERVAALEAQLKTANDEDDGPAQERLRSELNLLQASDAGGSFLVSLPARFVAAKTQNQAIVGWTYVEEGHLAADLRGKLYTVGRGTRLDIQGVGRLHRRPSNPGFSWDDWRDTNWSVDFTRRCPHEGLGCTFNDGAPQVTVSAPAAPSCVAGLASKVPDFYEAWRQLSPTAPDAQKLATWVTDLAPASDTAKRISATGHLRLGELDAAAELFSEVRDADGLASVAELQFKKPETSPAGVAILDAAIAITPRTAWMLRAAGMVLQAGNNADAVARLNKVVEASSDPKELKQAAGLLKFAGDATGAAAATAKAASPLKP